MKNIKLGGISLERQASGEGVITVQLALFFCNGFGELRLLNKGNKNLQVWCTTC